MDKRSTLIDRMKVIRTWAAMEAIATHDCIYITQTMDDAIELLDSPAKVKIYHDNGITSWCVCGRCSANVSKGDKYCHECGRALKWSG